MNPLTITERLHQDPRTPAFTLVLPFDQRVRSRQLATLATGEQARLLLERGLVLRDGDKLQTDDGRVVQVVAAPETVSTIRAEDPWRLARASYHLGNRHVPVQIGAGWLRIRHDHVLDDMLRGQGFEVVVEEAPFEPESGAYGSTPHAHTHDHDHD